MPFTELFDVEYLMARGRKAASNHSYHIQRICLLEASRGPLCVPEPAGEPLAKQKHHTTSMSPKKKQQHRRALTEAELAERVCSVCEVPVPGAYTFGAPRPACAAHDAQRGSAALGSACGRSRLPAWLRPLCAAAAVRRRAAAAQGHGLVC
jgi:hypothetical protein